MTAIRHPAVAGRFYPANPAALLDMVHSCLLPKKQTLPAIACMAPHAGYVYSGQVAGTVYAALQIPRRCVILCPNHTGLGHPLAIMTQGVWRTPLGDSPVDSDFGDTLKRRFPLLVEDSEAHRAEHAVEVELPFLQVCRADFALVPIAIGTHQFEVLQGLGEAIAHVIAQQTEPTLMIASSDMNHYQSDLITRGKDGKALEQILALDPQGLLEVATGQDISMCGLGATVVMLTSARRLGATRAELTGYATSGDTSGDREMVVGYAGVIVR
jgi:AmmeMemoRadiSam system protein B